MIFNHFVTSYEAIETNLIPVGISGIEDLLQDEVYDTIDVLVSLAYLLVSPSLWCQCVDDYRR